MIAVPSEHLLNVYTYRTFIYHVRNIIFTIANFHKDFPRMLA